MYLVSCTLYLIPCTLYLVMGRYPVHLVPEPWRVYLQRSQGKRGLFFLDGEEWWSARSRLNPLFLKAESVRGMEAGVEAGVEELLEPWLEGRLGALEGQLYRWSTGGEPSTWP